MQFNWSVDSFGDSKHDICSENEENIIKEKQGQQHEAVLEVSEEHGLESMNTENEAQNVVEYKAFEVDVAAHLDHRDDEAKYVKEGNLELKTDHFDININDIFLVISIKGPWRETLDECFNSSCSSNTDVEYYEIVYAVLAEVLHTVIETTERSTCKEWELPSVVEGHLLNISSSFNLQDVNFLHLAEELVYGFVGSDSDDQNRMERDVDLNGYLVCDATDGCQGKKYAVAY